VCSAGSRDATAMDVILTEAAEESFRNISVEEDHGAFRSSLDGEEMKKLWKHKELVCEAVLVKDKDGLIVPESQALHDLLLKMFELFDDVTAVLLALEWDHDRSEELEQKFRRWRDHIQEGFGQHVRMPIGSTFMSCMPAHYGAEA